MNSILQKTVNFLGEKFDESPFYAEHKEDREYRYNHTMRVANIGKRIAKAENLDETALTIGCLLHDISYCRNFEEINGWQEHGRVSAKIARPFLKTLGLSNNVIEDICYGIAIHVDDEADFDGERTAFALSIGDADNIDRFDAYRLYEGLQKANLPSLTLKEQRAYVQKTLERLEKYARMEMSTKTATNLFHDRINFQIQFYRRLKSQFSASVLS